MHESDGGPESITGARLARDGMVRAQDKEDQLWQLHRNLRLSSSPPTRHGTVCISGRRRRETGSR
jgi:hypothetical protein